VGYSRARWQDKLRIERLAKSIREQLNVDQYAVLDPWRVADAVPAHVFYPEDILDAQRSAKLRLVNWDGLCFSCDDDPTLIVLLNSGRSQSRQTATLMEELSHHILRHTPTRLVSDETTGVLRREFNRAQEDEAYDLGATILLPKELLQREVSAGHSAATIAKERYCSSQLVEYRIRRCRLWQKYMRLAS
jgi:Zn-dependent peptidase ImmA (M78 family)